MRRIGVRHEGRCVLASESVESWGDVYPEPDHGLVRGASSCACGLDAGAIGIVTVGDCHRRGLEVQLGGRRDWGRIGCRRRLGRAYWLCRAGLSVLAFANAYVTIFKTKKNVEEGYFCECHLNSDSAVLTV